MEWHQETEHDDAIVEAHTNGGNCPECDFLAIDEDRLDSHVKALHSFPCEKCTLYFKSTSLLEDHMKTHGQNEVETSQMDGRTCCDQCDFSSVNLPEFITHLQDKHKQKPELVHCRHCEFKAINKQSLYDHIEMDHIEFAMLASVTASQSEMRSDFEVFKGELTNVLNKIVDDQNILKQELFIIRQKECESSENITKIDKSIANLTNIINNVSKSNVFQDQRHRHGKQKLFAEFFNGGLAAIGKQETSI